MGIFMEWRKWKISDRDDFSLAAVFLLLENGMIISQEKCSEWLIGGPDSINHMVWVAALLGQFEKSQSKTFGIWDGW